MKVLYWKFIFKIFKFGKKNFEIGCNKPDIDLGFFVNITLYFINISLFSQRLVNNDVKFLYTPLLHLTCHSVVADNFASHMSASQTSTSKLFPINSVKHRCLTGLIGLIIRAEFSVLSVPRTFAGSRVWKCHQDCPCGRMNVFSEFVC